MEELFFAVVVLYKPDNQILNRLVKIANSVDFLYVIVNQLEDFGELSCQIINSKFIILGENKGLAFALNVGIKKCFENEKCKYIVLFDQDSIPIEGSLRVIKATFKITIPNIGLIGHTILDIKNSKKNVVNNSKSAITRVNTRVNTMITSGSVFRIDVLKEVGLMDETLFIDYIDYEWCLRAKAKGFSILVANNAFLEHNVGDQFVNILGLKKPYHLNNIRHYYIIRNQLILLNRNYIPFNWKIAHWFKLCYRIPSYVLLSKNKVITIKLIFKAIKDFRANRIEYKKIKY